MFKYFYFVFLCLVLAIGCTRPGGQVPRQGDFAFYQYEVFWGDSLVFAASSAHSDSAQTFVESPELHRGDIFQEALMQQLPKLSVGDSIQFPIGEALEARLKLFQVIPREDYPKYIERGDQLRAAFEKRLEEIKKDMSGMKSIFESRAPAVADSALQWGLQLRTGSLDSLLRDFPPGIDYYLVRQGKGPIANKSSSWTWIHFCAFSPDGKILLNTYETNPVVVNRRGALLAPWLEYTVTRFPEGSVILLKVPYELAFGAESNVPVAPGTELYVLMEILRTNNMY